MIKGSIPALITPFKNGDIDKNALEDLVEWQIDEGSNGLVAVGTTGESPTLSHEEHQEVIEIIVKKTKGRVPVKKFMHAKVAAHSKINTGQCLSIFH